MNPAYASVAERLVERILQVAKERPEILDLTDAWDMFDVPGFWCRDIGPSMFQAQWALAEAKRRAKPKEGSA